MAGLRSRDRLVGHASLDTGFARLPSPAYGGRNRAASICRHVATLAIVPAWDLFCCNSERNRALLLARPVATAYCSHELD